MNYNYDAGNSFKVMMHRIMSFIIAIVIFSVFPGCEGPDPFSFPVQRSELPGRYMGNFGETDTNFVDILPDSIFVSYYKTRDGKLYVDTAKWGFIDREPTRYDKLRVFGYIQRHPEVCVEVPGLEHLQNRINISTDRGFLLIKGADVLQIEYCESRRQYYTKRINNPESDNNR